MIELTFIAGHRLFKFQIRNDKSLWGYNYNLKAWIPQDKIKIDISKEQKWIKEHTQEEIAKDIIKEISKGGGKLIKKDGSP